MNTKRLISASIFALISASAAQAADIMVPHQPSRAVQPAIVVPAFTWAGFYLGGQVGGFSGKTNMSFVGEDKDIPLSKDWLPKLSGFEGGLYIGSNIDLGDNFIFSIDTDLNWAGKKHTKTINLSTSGNASVDNVVTRSRRTAETPPSRPTSTDSRTPGKPAPGNPSGLTTTPSQSTPTRSSSPTPAAVPSAPAVNPTASTGTAKPNPTSSEVGRSEVSTSEGGGKVRSAERSASTEPTRSGGSGARSGEGLARTTPTSGKSTPTSSGVGRSGVSTDSGVRGGVQSAGTVSNSGARSASVSVAPASSASVKPAAVPAKSATVPAKPAVQSAPAAKSQLVLARSASSDESAEPVVNSGHNGASNGGGHGAHSHGAHHGAGHGAGSNPHGSGANPYRNHPHVSNPHGAQNVAGRSAQGTQTTDENGASGYGIEQLKKEISGLGLNQEGDVETISHTFKQNWGGATRVRIGFAVDRIMPYVAGGIAYAQFHDTISMTLKKQGDKTASSKNLTDETKTMVGYTLGGGIDFAMTDNVLVRAEYRYSDFGKKKFAKENLEISYKVNDFRVGVAYKF
ncbi:outer membrane beta-barrel protein [Bartonella heixiaziensis]|uniref:outer membrane protein n=1 Tax=Bartonella heixiaziensis TaxID=1461000 RepID=UPI003D24D3C2